MLNTIVKEYNGYQILLQDALIIKTTFVIWTVGTNVNIPQGIHPGFISKSTQIQTDNHHRVLFTDNILLQIMLLLNKAICIENDFINWTYKSLTHRLSLTLLFSSFNSKNNL